VATEQKLADARGRVTQQREQDRAGRLAGVGKAKPRRASASPPTPRRARPHALSTAPPEPAPSRHQVALVDHADLRTVFGIKFSRTHLWRLIRAGAFPAPVALGRTSGRPGSRKCWRFADVEQWLAELEYVGADDAA